jgi:hypothetical protein
VLLFGFMIRVLLLIFVCLDTSCNGHVTNLSNVFAV